jgi:hypothetical protein
VNTYVNVEKREGENIHLFVLTSVRSQSKTIFISHADLCVKGYQLGC